MKETRRKERTERKDRKEPKGDASFSERVRAKRFICAFKSSRQEKFICIESRQEKLSSNLFRTVQIQNKKERINEFY